jgi:hypothetical protein
MSAPDVSRQIAPRRESTETERPRPGERDDGPRLIEPRLVALFLAGCVLFGYPLPGLFDHPAEVAGLPALYVYLLVAWAGFIAALAWLFERREGWRRPSAGRGAARRR